MSTKLAERLAERLALSPSERRSLGLKAPVSPPEFELSSDSFHLISDWWHFAILNLVRVEGFRSAPSWIADRLGIPPSKAEAALELLLRLGLLARDRKGNLTRTHARIRTSDNIQNLALRRAHRLDLELIDRSLELPLSSRDSTSVTMTLDPAQLPRLQEMIRKFEDELMEEAESVPGREVYRLSIHLFPLTKTTKGETP